MTDVRQLKLALLLTGAGQAVQTDAPDVHSWVRHPADVPGTETIEWCQWCGTHRSETESLTNTEGELITAAELRAAGQDWTDPDPCPALVAVRAALNA